MPSERTPLLVDPASTPNDSVLERAPELEAVKRSIYPGPTPLPKRQLLCISFIQLGEFISWTFFYPYINEMIMVYDISGGDPTKVGYYAGLVASASFIADCVSVFLWGRLSDYIGRRPVIIIGLVALILGPIAFGFSQTLATLVLSRLLTGAFCGNIGILKALIADITDESNRAKAFSYTPAVMSLALVIAPLIGGNLSRPVERFPLFFGKSELLRVYPYLLPSVAVAVFPGIGIVMVLLVLRESSSERSHPKSLDSPTSSSNQGISPTGSEITLVPEVKKTPPPLTSLFTPQVRAAVFNYAAYCFLAFVIAFLLPLFMSTPTQYGGLGLSPHDIGTLLGVLGIYTGAVQIVLFMPLHRRLGNNGLFRLSIATKAVVCIFWPILGLLAKHTKSDKLSGALIALLLLQILFLPITRMGLSCSSIFLTSAAPSGTSVGATVGLGQIFASISRFLGPAFGAALFAVSIEKNILGGNLVYVVLIGFIFVSLIGTATLPRVVKRANEN
ncbi:MFS general substrate transporter [Sistotremastrum suecicum HHB10207 ss-3]|uniref:MFS general substrate transporter n=1 Tax=Sistotremastrum suecicum HHB10207 ss-3 TaxID=1314776 RepID=A0A165XLA3_9AGAM|nr:MFS general substrate transporter [Sistotremastrum suecicum HHB10207 ss-3]